MLRTIAYVLAAIEGIFLIGCIVNYVMHPPGAAGSGGPQMGLFFFVLVPLAVLMFALLLLWLGRNSSLISGFAMLIIAAPLLGLAWWGVREVQGRLASAEYASGRGYFSGRDAQALGAAIIARDLPGVVRLAAVTDVNAASGYKTFLRLAMEATPPELPIVQALLAAGSNPNDRRDDPLSYAIYLGSAPMLAMMLAAGGDPNRITGYSPVFFGAGRQPQLLPQLLDGGARIEAPGSQGRTMLLEATADRQWAAVDVLLARGANRAAVDRDGKTQADLLAEVKRYGEQNRWPTDKALLALEARLREGR